MNFKDFSFKDYINKGLENINFFSPTPIQEIVIKKALRGEKVIGKSQTGTGKTHAFVLPMLQRLDEDLKEIQSVIIVPTRELGFQLYEVISQLVKFCDKNIDIRLYIGGTDRENEIKRLEKSSPQIVIGTIGKLKDLSVDTNVLKIHTARMVIIDEADMVFEKSEIENIDFVFSKFMPEAQILVFSATISQEINVFLNKYLNKIEIIDLNPQNKAKQSIDHIFIPTKNKNKDELLLQLINNCRPYLALIFANTKQKVDEICDFLSNNGLKIAKLTGDLEPRERKQTLRRIKNGEYQYVVASDIAARGIDIAGVSHIINYELPQDVEFYIHRTGRTARFDSTGTAISFYDFSDDRYLNLLEKKHVKGIYMALKDGELVPTKERNARENRIKKETLEEENVHKKIPLGKKVKPGYRKKRNEEIKKEIRKIKRSKIEEIYKRKAKNKND